MEQSQVLAHSGTSKITHEELSAIPTPAGAQLIDALRIKKFSGLQPVLSKKHCAWYCAGNLFASLNLLLFSIERTP